MLQNFVVDGCVNRKEDNIIMLGDEFYIDRRILDEATSIDFPVEVEAEDYDDAIEKVFSQFYKRIDDILGDINHEIFYNKGYFSVNIYTTEDVYNILRIEDIECYRH